MVATKENILNAAESIFAEKGYNASSIRAIVNAAGVNIAAVSYHFKNKETLFKEVAERRILAIESKRFAMLEANMLANNGSPTLEGIVRSFLEPLAYEMKNNGKIPKMLVRIFVEAPEIKERLLRSLFEKTRSRFLEALQLVYPGLSGNEVLWRLQYLITSMVGAVIYSDELNYTANQLKIPMMEKVIQQTLYGLRGELNS
jgi:AcrR family transcriptional regulator